jgi:hypothetical protein
LGKASCPHPKERKEVKVKKKTKPRSRVYIFNQNNINYFRGNWPKELLTVRQGQLKGNIIIRIFSATRDKYRVYTLMHNNDNNAL